MNLTIKQERFVQSYVDTGNGTQAVKDAGYNVKNNNVAGRIASANVRKSNIKQAIAVKKSAIADVLEQKSMLLLIGLLELAEHSPNDSIRLKACQDLLDRAGYGAKNNLSISSDSTVVMETRHTSELAKRVRLLLQKEGEINSDEMSMLQ